ncbi:MAG: ATP-binding protein [Spirochaetaceae bacterium]|jgi:hypothetical protein|nr:ATP-binding protein [Spirochaetaceae bacterium]
MGKARQNVKALRKMPIGIQDFEDLRTKGYVYVDKTAYVWKLVTESKPYFLSRPRRFGKSLLLTTLKAYFQGKKELFDGLAIAGLETEWLEYPVLHLDFNPLRYDSVSSLNDFVANLLKQLESEYELPAGNDRIEIRFQNLINDIYKKTGRQVVVLIDEYDKPLLESLGDEKLNADLRATLKPFYGVLKSADAALRFVMLTGVTRFSKVSVFSDLNQLNEIGMDTAFSCICGITENELLENFEPELEALAEANGESFEETLSAMRKNFNGYRFTKKNERVYNPFSLLNTFFKQDIQYYWFATGTPTFLFTELERTGFDVQQFNGDITVSEIKINDYQPGDTNPVPLLYQTGYLTITGFNARKRRYNLGFPNEEVKYGFLGNLLPRYIRADTDKTNYYVGNLSDTFEAGDLEGFFRQLRAFFGLIPYDLQYEKTESYYQTIFFVVFILMGQFIETEVRSAVGRADAVVKTRDTVYVFEFKLDSSGTVEEALKQIDDRGYLIPYSADGRRLVKVGVVFDTEKRTVGEWAAVAVQN